MSWRTLGLRISSLRISPSSSLRRGVLCRSFVARSDGGEFRSLPTAGESDGGELPPSLTTAGEDDFDDDFYDDLDENDPFYGLKRTVYADPSKKPTIYIDDPARDRPDGIDIYMSEFYHELMYGPPRSRYGKPKFVDANTEVEDLDENTEDFGPEWLEDSASGTDSKARWFKDCISNIGRTAHQSKDDASASRRVVSTDVSPETAITVKNFMEEMAKIVHSHSDKNSDADEAAGKPVFHGDPHVPKQGPVIHGSKV